MFQVDKRFCTYLPAFKFKRNCKLNSILTALTWLRALLTIEETWRGREGARERIPFSLSLLHSPPLSFLRDKREKKKQAEANDFQRGLTT